MTSNQTRESLQDLAMKIPNFRKLIIYTTFLTSTIIIISSTNLFIIWISLELNLLSFIPIILNEATTNEREASINYFMAQALGSTIFLLARSRLSGLYWSIKLRLILIIISLLLKIGAVPCHYWYPTTIEIIRWTNCFILSTWQKLAPLLVLMYIIIPNINYLTTAITSSLNALIGGIMGLRQTSLKKIISYSSITHIGWMLRASSTNTPCISIAYLFLYRMLILPLFSLFNKIGSNKIYDIWNKQKLAPQLITIISTLLLSLSGLPPLTGFIPKLLIINILIKYSIIHAIILIIGSLINLFFYLNISLNMLITNQQYIYSKINIKAQLTINTIINLNFLSLFIIILYALIIFIKPQRYWNHLLYSWHLSRLYRNNNKNSYSHRTSPARTTIKQ